MEVRAVARISKTANTHFTTGFKRIFVAWADLPETVINCFLEWRESWFTIKIKKPMMSIIIPMMAAKPSPVMAFKSTYEVARTRKLFPPT